MKKPTKKRNRLDRAGQATLEFALTLILLMSTVFFFIHSSFGLAWSSYVQYATFMSARAYLAAGPNPEEQVDRARSVASRMLKKKDNPGEDRLPMIAKGDSQDLDGADEVVPGLAIGFHPAIAAQAQAGDPSYSWMQGVRYRFKSRLFLLPFGGANPAEKKNQLELQSESWLGREPSRSECLEYFTGTLSLRAEEVVLDNGC